MSLTKQALVSNTVEVHNSTMGKVKAGKFFCVCGHCDHHITFRMIVLTRAAGAAQPKFSYLRLRS